MAISFQFQLGPKRATGWEGFDDHELFELRFDRVLLTLTEPEGDFQAGHTSWRT